MTPLTKKTIVAFLFSGLIFAGLSAGFDYSDGMEFRLWRFIFKAFFFGFFMALMLRYNLKKNEAAKDNK